MGTQGRAAPKGLAHEGLHTKLTPVRPRWTMQVMVHRIRAIVSGLVMAGILASGVATCTAGEIMSETAQMACCDAGHHTCGKDGAPADCCRKNSTPQPQWNTVDKTDSLNAPVRLFLALVTPVSPLSVGA